jgi:methylated-DNA-protein-cysteine methyltransferase related protein
MGDAAGTFDLLPLESSIEGMNPMNWKGVYALVKKIPRGRVTTYGQLAKALRLPGGARTAGHAMAASPSGQGVPWHRVVGAGGRLLIREPHASLQRKLLESEGLELAEKRILNFKKFDWSPSKTKRRGSPGRKEKG